jgi:alpha-beta hydrolase superfamily lysophospholipase
MIRTKLMNDFQPRWLIRLIAGIMLTILFSAIVLSNMTPWNLATLSSHPRPVQSYAEALQRIESLRGQEPPGMNPLCQLQLLTHDKQVARAIILIHGYTNCPHQFHTLGQRFYELGYNVLIAPLPHHGLADRMTDAYAQLKAEELAAYADETVDIAQGLGERVVMVGFSAGGVAAAWAAQHRRDLNVAVLIAPAFGFKAIPTPLTATAMNLFLMAPNSYGWWDPARQAEGEPRHAYPRYSRRALAQILRLGFAVQTAAQQAPPATHNILVVTNANDNAVNNGLTTTVVNNWRDHGANLTAYEFATDQGLGHDLIDPAQPDARTDLVYPRLIDLISTQ